MKNSYRLFGRPIIPSYQLTLAEQTRDILCEEIHAGRWRVDDRLPSISALARQSGLSRFPIQRAFEMLREEGYVRQEERKGTFLKSMLPRQQGPEGVIGVVMFVMEQDGETLTLPQYQWWLHGIIEEASRRRLLTEVAYLHSEEASKNVDLPGSLFSKRIGGALSMVPFEYPIWGRVPNDRLPVVFVGQSHKSSVPSVQGDGRSGFYVATRRLIEKGHREIALCLCHVLYPQSLENNVSGYVAAMEEAGLAPQPVRFEATAAEADLAGFFSENKRFTAALCNSNFLAQRLIGEADAAGVRVPEDFSIIGHGYREPMRSTEPQKLLTSVNYPNELFARHSLDLLTEAIRTRRFPLSHVRVMGDVIDGVSDAVPPSCPTRPNDHRARQSLDSVS